MVRAVDTEQQPVEKVPAGHFIMYPTRETMEVRVIGAEDNAGMSHRLPLVQPQKLRRFCVRSALRSDAAYCRTSSSETDRFALPASCDVKTS
jgi:hypothetical protein